ncbi:MAG: hypothetical protein KDC57_03945 [Saprospiraceae bacterium]|nr:hypothetical protein [Saprospiraceae bacterium]
MELKNSTIDAFEAFVPERILLEAEQRWDAQNEIPLVQSMGKSLYRTIIPDGGQELEVELVVKGNTLRRYTCDCHQFKEDKLCTHIVLGLFAYRHFAEIQKARKKAKQEARRQMKPAAGPSFQQIIDVMSIDELRLFIRQQAQKNRQLQHELKLTFAHKISSEDEFSKYDQLLYQLFKPTTAMTHITKRKCDELCGVLTQLIDQSRDFTALEKWREAGALLTAVYRKIRYLILKAVEEVHPALLALQKHWYLATEALLEKPIPPLLREEIIRNIIEVISSVHYQVIDPARNGYRLLYTQQVPIQEITDLVQLHNSQVHFRSHLHALWLLYILDGLTLREYFLTYPNHRIHLKSFVQYLQDQELFLVLQQVALLLYEDAHTDHAFREQLTWGLMMINSESSFYQPLWLHFWSTVKNNKMLPGLFWLLEHDPEAQSQARSWLNVPMNQDDTSRRIRAILLIWLEEQTALAEWLIQLEDLRLIRQVLSFWHQHWEPEAIEQLLTPVIIQHLEQYAGTQPIKYLHDLYNTMIHLGMRRQAENSEEAVKTHFAHRSSIQNPTNS